MRYLRSISALLLLLICCLFVTAAPAVAENFVLDPSFGTDIGFTAVDFGTNTSDYCINMIVPTADVILAGGTEDDCAFVKINNSSGNIIEKPSDNLSPGEDDYAVSLVEEGDGNFIVVGVVDQPSTHAADIFVAKYDSHFNRVTSWGNNGFVSTDFGAGSDYVRDVEISGDLIYVCGEKDGWELEDEDIVLARYDLADGTPDTTFGPGGVKILNNSTGTDRAYDMLIHNSTIYVAGGYTNDYENNRADFSLLRFDMDGSLLGVTSTDFFGLDDLAQVVRFSLGGKILVGGLAYETYSPDQVAKFVLAQYELNGDLDTGFGEDGNGIVSMDLPPGIPGSDPRVSDIEFTSEGKILCSITPFDPGNIILARFDADGSLDTGFCDEGFLYIPLGSEGYVDVQIRSIHMVNDDIIFVGAKGQKSSDPWDTDFIVAKLVDESIISSDDDDDFVPPTDDDDDGGGGCNAGSFIPLSLLLLIPLAFMFRK